MNLSSLERYQDLSDYKALFANFSPNTVPTTLRQRSHASNQVTVYNLDHLPATGDQDGWTTYHYSDNRKECVNAGVTITSREFGLGSSDLVSVTSKPGVISDFYVEKRWQTYTNGQRFHTLQVYPQRKLETLVSSTAGMSSLNHMDVLCTRVDIGLKENPKLLSLIFDPSSARPVIQLVDGSYVDWDTLGLPFSQDITGYPTYFDDEHPLEIEGSVAVGYREQDFPGGISRTIFEYSGPRGARKSISISFPQILASEWGENLPNALSNPMIHPNEIMEILDSADFRLN